MPIRRITTGFCTYRSMLVLLAATAVLAAGCGSSSSKGTSPAISSVKASTSTSATTATTAITATIAAATTKPTTPKPPQQSAADIALGNQLRVAFRPRVVHPDQIRGPIGAVTTATVSGYQWVAASLSQTGGPLQGQPSFFYRAPGGAWTYADDSSIAPCGVPYDALIAVHQANIERGAFDKGCQLTKLGSADGANDGLHFQTMTGLVTCRLKHHNGPVLDCYRVGGNGDGYELTGQSLTPTSLPRVEADGVIFQDHTTHQLPLDGVVFHCAMGYDSVRCTASSSAGHGFVVSGDSAHQF